MQVQLTETILLQGSTSAKTAAWTWKQLKLLGVAVPLRSGWKYGILGRLYPADVVAEFLSLGEQGRAEAVQETEWHPRNLIRQLVD